MSLFGSETPTVLPTTEDQPLLRRLPRWFFPYAAVVALAAGVFIEWRTDSVVISCRRAGDAPLSCTLERRVFLGTVPIGSETVTGVGRARTRARSGYRRRSARETWVVQLETAQGERVVGRSIVEGTASVLTNAINHHIDAGAASFEETLRPHLFDRVVRLFGVLCGVGGMGLALLSAWLWWRPTPNP